MVLERTTFNEVVMLCDFKNINEKWICLKCGRQTPMSKDNYMPSAKCRIPEHYRISSGYIYNERIKGVGDSLSEIIKKIGYNYSPVSRARSKITYLNKKGIDWCEANQKIILYWIKEECVHYNIQYLELLAKSILRLAIRKAKNASYFNV